MGGRIIGSGTFPGKMLLVRIIKVIKLILILSQVRFINQKQENTHPKLIFNRSSIKLGSVSDLNILYGNYIIRQYIIYFLSILISLTIELIPMLIWTGNSNHIQCVYFPLFKKTYYTYFLPPQGLQPQEYIQVTKCFYQEVIVVPI